MFNYNYLETVNRLKMLLEEPDCPQNFVATSYSNFKANVAAKQQQMLECPALEPVAPCTSLARANCSPRPSCEMHVCNGKLPYEISTFIEKQNQYIEHLEKESKFCREELNNILEKIKNILSDEDSCPACVKTCSKGRGLLELECPNSDTEDILKSARSTLSEYKSYDNNMNNKIHELEYELGQCNNDLQKLKSENNDIQEKIVTLNHKSVFPKKSYNYFNYFDEL
ncbi:SDCCAG8 family protein [Megaselia abdita]